MALITLRLALRSNYCGDLFSPRQGKAGGFSTLLSASTLKLSRVTSPRTLPRGCTLSPLLPG